MMAFVNTEDPRIDYLIISRLGGCYATPIIQFFQDPAPIFCRQVALSFLSLCAQDFVPRTTIDIANLPKLDRSNKSHP
jgi:hypothetical protein